MLLLLSSATFATAKNWNDGTGNWNLNANWSPASVPVASEAVNIVFSDGVARTVTLNTSPPSLGLFTIDLTGAGTAASTLSMPNNTTLSANGILVGGYNGITGVATAGRAAATQSAGTTSTNPGWDFVLGYGANSTGSYTLSGTGALVAYQSEYVGLSGNGTFSQSAGSNTIQTQTGFFDIGSNTGSTGTYNLSGSGALLVKTTEFLGDSGTGVFNQNGGTHSITNGTGLYLGYSVTGGGGTYALNGGSLSVQGVAGSTAGEYIGYFGPGTFTQTGGTNSLTQGAGLHVGFGAGSNASYTLNAGSLASGGEIIGESGTGTFTQTGGTNSTDSASNVFLGYGVGSNGTYTLSGLGSFSPNHEFWIGYNGSGTFNQNGGSVSISSLYIAGAAGLSTNSTGTYNLTAGSLVSQFSFPVEIGAAGTGTFNQSGGTSNFGGAAMSIGGAGGTGTFLLSGGSAAVGGVTIHLGAVTVSGSGVLTIAGTLAAPSNGANVNLNGGTINTAALDLSDTPARLNWTTGKLNLTSDVTWDTSAVISPTARSFGPALALTNNQTLAVTGNETLGGINAFSLTLNSGSTHTVGGAITINPTGTLTQNAGSTLSAVAITQAGGTINGTLQNQTAFTYQSGAFNGRLINQGTFTFGSNFTAGNGVEIDTTMTLAPGQTLTTNGAGLETHALFTVANGGNLFGTSASSGSEFIVNGFANVTTFTNSSLLHGTGQVTAATTNSATGDIRVAVGEHLRFAGASFTNQGLVEAIGNATSAAEIEFNTPVINAASSGLITGRNNVLRFNSGLANQGSVAVSIGSTDVFGDINNTGSIVVSGGAGATFYDDIVQNGTFRVSKVGSTTSVAVIFGAFSGSGGSTGGGDIFIEGDLRPGNSPASVMYGNNIAIGGGASINIELAGTTPGSQYDQVHVAGQLALDGALKVSLVNFNPSSGQSFDILDWGSLSGTFAALQLPTLSGGLQWNTSQLYTAGILSIGIPGDYNANGVVDAADYVAWRKGLGTTYTQNDYDVWRSHFGQTASGSANASVSVAVPEPAMSVLLTFAATGWRLRRRRAT